MPTVQLRVRAARPDDEGVPGLLYESAAPYYDAYAGSRERALRVLSAIYGRPGHSASFGSCRVAELDGRVVGVLAAFPAAAADRLARRFLVLTVPRVGVRQWPGLVRNLRASARLTPPPPPGTFYVDALAVAPDARRRGVATALLAAADALARRAGASAVALDTGVENEGAQALYEAAGFERTGIRETDDPDVAAAVGGRGFVSYVRRL